MNNHQRRLKTIELGMTPQQIVLLWLANAQKTGSLIDASRQSPFPRRAIATRVIDVIRPSMKGEPKPVIQDAIMQARREADFLYMLIVIANNAVEEEISWLDLSFAIFARQYFTVEFAERHDLKDVGLIEMLRESMRLVVERYIILKETCSRITAVQLSGQEVLFPDVAAKLREKMEQLDVLGRLNGGGSYTKPKKMFSAATRRKLSLAQKARWAKVNGQAQKPKRTMSASARRKIAAAQRARWAKLKKRA